MSPFGSLADIRVRDWNVCKVPVDMSMSQRCFASDHRTDVPSLNDGRNCNPNRRAFD
jgi:hypothetical protein